MSAKRRPIPGFENYTITPDGTVFNSSGYRMRPLHTSTGYVHITLRHNRKKYCKYLHRLVAEAFVPKISGKTYVNHLNGNRSDNRAENLAWVTASENMQHMHARRGER